MKFVHGEDVGVGLMTTGDRQSSGRIAVHAVTNSTMSESLIGAAPRETPMAKTAFMKKMLLSIGLCFVAVFSWPSSSQAQEGQKRCFGVLSLADKPRLMRIAPGSSVTLDCGRCKTKTTIAADQLVVAGATLGRRVCVSELEKGGLVLQSGWLPIDSLQSVGRSVSSDWAGTWNSGPYRKLQIKVSRQSNAIEIYGDATFNPSYGNEADLRTGSIAAEVRPVDGEVSFAIGYQPRSRSEKSLEASNGEEQYTLPYAADVACKVAIHYLSNDYLFVEDSGSCGGAGVSFSGPYQRG